MALSQAYVFEDVSLECFFPQMNDPWEPGHLLSVLPEAVAAIN